MDTNQQPNSTGPQTRRRRIPLCWLLLISFDVGLMALTMAQDPNRQSPAPPVQTVETTITGPGELAADAEIFEAIDVFVDSGPQQLAAWQLALMSKTRGVEIVGIEGGEHPAFAEPPYYDPRAMNNNRVILAAFSTGNDLPKGRSRVARIHVLLRGPGDRLWHTELTTSASADGTKIPAEISIAKAQG